MSAEKTRGHYARWEAELTKRLIRLILTEEPLKDKMQSLVDKHHTKREDRTTHLKYGIMKHYAIQIGLGRGDSRALSIKMINIAKSYGRKRELGVLFAQGWRLAKELRESEQAKRRSRSSNGFTNVSELEDIVERITEKVTKFTRPPSVSRQKKVSKAAAHSQKRGRPQAVSPQASPSFNSPLPTKRGRPIETRSQESVVAARPRLDLDDERLSRGGESAVVPFPTSRKNLTVSDNAEGSRETLEHMIETMRPRSRNPGPEQMRRFKALRRIIDLHFCIWEDEPQLHDPARRREADRLLKETIMRVLAQEHGAAGR